MIANRCAYAPCRRSVSPWSLTDWLGRVLVVTWKVGDHRGGLPFTAFCSAYCWIRDQREEADVLSLKSGRLNENGQDTRVFQRVMLRPEKSVIFRPNPHAIKFLYSDLKFRNGKWDAEGFAALCQTLHRSQVTYFAPVTILE